MCAHPSQRFQIMAMASMQVPAWRQEARKGVVAT